MSSQTLAPKLIPNFERFNEAQFQVHSIVQWLAHIENSYRPEAIRSSPIRLRWSEDRRAIATGTLVDNLALELRLPEMVLQFLEYGEPVNHAIMAEEHSPAHVEAWLLIELLHRGVDRSQFIKSLPYDVSHLLSGDGKEFSPEIYEEELTLLTQWLSRAANAIRSVVARAADVNGLEVLVSPEDLSLEMICSNCVVGFTPVGSVLDEPYFYVLGGLDVGQRSNDVVAASVLFNGSGDNQLESLIRGHLARPH